MSGANQCTISERVTSCVVKKEHQTFKFTSETTATQHCNLQGAQYLLLTCQVEMCSNFEPSYNVCVFSGLCIYVCVFLYKNIA